MSDLIDKAHADAVLGLLHAALDPVPISVFDGKVPDPTPDVAAHPWVLVYFDADWPIDGAGNSLDGTSRTYVLRAWCHSAAASAAGARAIAGQVRAALLNVIPTITGRTSGMICHIDGQPANPDETLGFLVVDKVDVYELMTTG
jgi:hypothetical protein